MTLKAQAQAAVGGLAPFAQGQHEVAAADAGQRLTAELHALDALALALGHLTLASDAISQAPIDRLKQVADALSKRLTYLLEPISPIEVDADQCVVQMRSSPPQRDDNGTKYFELLVRRGGELSLRRYQKQPGDTRQAIPAQLTREVFFRLVDDFSNAAS